MTDAAPKRLVLVGTVHRDARGLERLASVLEALHPTQLTLEMSPTAVAFRRTRSPALLLRLERILDRLAAEEGYPRPELARHPAVMDIQGLLALPFEYRAAQAFADRVGTPLALIDLPDVSRRKLGLVDQDLISYRNLRTLVRLPPREAPAEDYASARALLRPGIPPEVIRDFLRRRLGEEGIGPRDAHMAGEIRRRLGGERGGCLVHIGGWVHLLADPGGKTLFSRLADLAPERRLLD